MVSVALLLAVIGLVIGWRRMWRMPESVSELAYVIPKWLFTLWLSLVGIAMMMPMIDALPVNWSWLCVTWCAGMMAAAATPFYGPYDRVLHYIGGVSAAAEEKATLTGEGSFWICLWRHCISVAEGRALNIKPERICLIYMEDHPKEVRKLDEDT